MSRHQLLAANLLLVGAAHGLLPLLGGVALWGLHLGMTQGLLAATVADTTPHDLRGTAFGIFNRASGVALLAASVLAGELWVRMGPAATFGAGAGLCALALIGALALRQGKRA